MDVVVVGERGNPEFGDAGLCSFDPVQPCTQNAPALIAALQGYIDKTAEAQAIYDAVRRRAPYAQIVVPGFPPVVPKPGDDISVCSWFLSPDEVQPLYDLLIRLNAMIKELAEKNGAIFVDMFAADSPWMQGRHDLCAPFPNAWIWGPRLSIPPYDGDLLNPEIYAHGALHPTTPGQVAIGDQIKRAMLEHAPAAR